jgi:hypothetical protein
VDHFHHEPDPMRKNGWRVVRVTPEGQRTNTPRRFRNEDRARSFAYQLEVTQERRRHAPYLGD